MPRGSGFADSAIAKDDIAVRRRVTTTKTYKIRRVEMSPPLATTLATLRNTRQMEASMAGRMMTEWVFVGPTGRRLSNELLRRGSRPVRTRSVSDAFGFIICGMFASLLIQQGANVKYIQQQLGHGSISITLDVYSHLFEGDHRHQVSRLDDAEEATNGDRSRKPDSATQPQPAVEGLDREDTQPLNR